MNSSPARSLPPGVRPALLLLAAVLLFFWRLAFTNLILPRGDTLLYFYPYWDYRAEALRAGRIPLWNPYLFMGAPFLANPQAGVLYPLNWPLAFLPVTSAVETAILAHVALAAMGAYAFGRKALGLRRDAAWAAGLTYGLGGYLSAHVEQVNQLQGLAWLPWAFWALEGARQAPRRYAPRLAVVLALQILAGHTQTAFVTIVGLGVWTLAAVRPGMSHVQRRWLGACLLAAFAAVLLSAAQILPTLELSRYSLRGGGLSAREAVSFSLHPRLVGRALLPGYSHPLFGEYVAYVGVVGLMAAGLGMTGAGGASGTSGTRVPSYGAGVPSYGAGVPSYSAGASSGTSGTSGTGVPSYRLAALVVVGMLFALGGYDPLYYALAHLPGFNFFRAPARWLALGAFGQAALVGIGVQAAARRRPTVRQIAPSLLAVLGVIGYSYASAGLQVGGETGPLPAPTLRDLVAWLAAAIVAIAALRGPAAPRLRGALLCAALGAELFLASARLPFNALTAPEAWYSQRPAMDHLLAAEGNPPARFLSMSALLFDPGDAAELQSNWEGQLTAEGIFLATVATKHKEVLSPNLPLAWRLPAVDGYDGGILPLTNYAAFEALFVPPDRVAPDGRLRENLTDVPDGWLLSLTNTRWLITDKVGDIWLDDVYYDLQHRAELAHGQTAEVAYLPRFKATALGVIANLRVLDLPPDAPVAEFELQFDDGARRVFTLRAGDDVPDPAGIIRATRLRWEEANAVTALRVRGLWPEGAVVVRGLTLIDERSGAFQSLTISSRGRFRLAHSGEVKVYENLEALPRAFVVGRAVYVGDDAAAAARLAASDFDPASEVVVTGPATASAPPGGVTDARAQIVEYEPERIAISVETDLPGHVFLSDAWFPGWVATVNGAPAPIERADILFRAVPVPAGRSSVAFEYRPRLFYAGAVISALAVLALVYVLRSTQYVIRNP